MEHWRLIDLGKADPITAQAFYEAVAEAVHRGVSPNTLILVQPASPYACIGYHQDAAGFPGLIPHGFRASHTSFSSLVTLYTYRVGEILN